MRYWTECREFFRQFRERYDTTGSVLPSSRALARALTRPMRELAGPRRVIEVGPGTGAVTRHICSSLHPSDRVDLCELNAAFVDVLHRRLAEERPFCDVASCVSVHHRPIEALPIDAPYDHIVSGLPLNNFEVGEVEHILALFSRLLKPNGTLSFFEYIGIRKLRAVVSNRPGRRRLQGITSALDNILRPGEFRRDHVWRNVPPAYVHHVRLG